LGIGSQLLSAAEGWARASGCRRLVVATRITRERAHRLYAREGYRVSKTSYFLTKDLSAGAGDQPGYTFARRDDP
jgi:GNAT superfamily N-acetyltransferase